VFVVINDLRDFADFRIVSIWLARMTNETRQVWRRRRKRRYKCNPLDAKV
jgi:hypothetical protein